MLDRPLRLLLVATIALSTLPGCSSMSKSGRQQARYAKYVGKHSKKRVVQKKKSKKIRMPLTPESQPVMHASAADAPQSSSSNPNE